jgi:lipopolysaccharide cholinephosphotransferase
MSEKPLKTRMKQADINRLYSILHRINKAAQLSGLRYWICAGTALGAVRHGGLIPWDDDGDIYVPEADFQATALLFYRALNIYGLHMFPHTIRGRESDSWFKIFDDVSQFPNVDVFLVAPTGTSASAEWRMVDPSACKMWPKEYLRPEEAASTVYVPFGPLRLPIFAHADRYFERGYGKDWATTYYEGGYHEDEYNPQKREKPRGPSPLTDRRPALPTISFV